MRRSQSAPVEVAHIPILGESVNIEEQQSGDGGEYQGAGNGVPDGLADDSDSLVRGLWR
jgi:hypothetical protein